MHQDQDGEFEKFLENSSSTLLKFPPLTRDVSKGTSSVMALHTRRTKEEMASLFGSEFALFAAIFGRRLNAR